MNVSPEVLEGVDADDGVEFVILEREVAHVGVRRRDSILDACLAKNLVYLPRIDPQWHAVTVTGTALKEH